MKFTQMPYERADIDSAIQDLGRLTEQIGSARTGEEAFSVHQKMYELSDRIETQVVLAHIRHDIDMTDSFYEQEQAYYDAHLPGLFHARAQYRAAVLASRFRPFLEEKIGKTAFTNMELQKKSVDQAILPLMQEENRLQTRYAKLLATARIDWNGEQLNLSLMTPYTHSADRSIRKEAWEKYSGFFTENAEELDEIYDLLVKNRTQQAEKLGHKNYLTLGYYRMKRNCYGRKDIQDFRKQVKEDLVPFAQKIHESRRKRLGVSRLQYFDEGIAFAGGNPAPFGTPQQILEAGRTMYRALSPETGEFMDFMCDHDLFDVLGKKSKRTGGYMTYLPDWRSPFIFANFNGTSGDVNVITHECGHAFQGYIAGRDPIREHADISMETAETHSMSMEFFTGPWMELFFGEKAPDYRTMHFED